MALDTGVPARRGYKAGAVGCYHLKSPDGIPACSATFGIPTQVLPNGQRVCYDLTKRMAETPPLGEEGEMAVGSVKSSRYKGLNGLLKPGCWITALSRLIPRGSAPLVFRRRTLSGILQSVEFSRNAA